MKRVYILMFNSSIDSCYKDMESAKRALKERVESFPTFVWSITSYPL